MHKRAHIRSMRMLLTSKPRRIVSPFPHNSPQVSPATNANRHAVHGPFRLPAPLLCLVGPRRRWPPDPRPFPSSPKPLSTSIIMGESKRLELPSDASTRSRNDDDVPMSSCSCTFSRSRSDVPRFMYGRWPLPFCSAEAGGGGGDRSRGGGPISTLMLVLKRLSSGFGGKLRARPSSGVLST